MRETEAIVERVTRLSAALSRVEIASDFAPGSIQPGQYLLARLYAGWDPYLRERWQPVRFADRLMIVDRHAEAGDQPGQVVSLLGPCGKPIPIRREAQHLLLIAQDAVPSALVALALKAVEEGRSVTLVLGGAAQVYPLDALPPEVEVLHADRDWKWPAQVDAFTWAEQVVALAPPETDFYARLWQTLNQLRIYVPERFAFGLFLPPTPCGVGACQACLVRGKRKNYLACTEGPALDLDKLAL
ncbi:MAG: hypothetical protein Kow00120_16080 [Anaerolineae bacterium]